MQHVSLCPSFTGGSGRSPAQLLCSSWLSGLPMLRNQLASLCPHRKQPMLLNLRHLPELPASLHRGPHVGWREGFRENII